MALLDLAAEVDVLGAALRSAWIYTWRVMTWIATLHSWLVYPRALGLLTHVATSLVLFSIRLIRRTWKRSLQQNSLIETARADSLALPPHWGVRLIVQTTLLRIQSSRLLSSRATRGSKISTHRLRLDQVTLRELNSMRGLLRRLRVHWIRLDVQLGLEGLQVLGVWLVLELLLLMLLFIWRNIRSHWT